MQELQDKKRRFSSATPGEMTVCVSQEEQSHFEIA
jgi:hypothetical protein